MSEADSDSRSKEIERLLGEGLDCYGLGETSQAIQIWQSVLALDSDNAQAVDYIENADRRRHPNRRDSADAPLGSFHGLVTHGQDLVAEKQLGRALQVFSRAEGAEFAALELGATVDLVRSRLLHEYRDELGGRDAIPALCVDAEALTEIDLPADADSIVALVDGSTKLEDLVSHSGLEKFEAIRILRTLWAAGALENRA